MHSRYMSKKTSITLTRIMPYLFSIYKMSEIYSYDKHFDRIDWLKRLEPGLVSPSAG
jgi:predicted nucleic acid-binding protein